MSDYCTDRDLLSIEPVVFIGDGFPGQKLIAGDTGNFTGTTFTISGASFTAAGIEAGMVLCAYENTPAEGGGYEVVSVASTTQLTASVLRVDTADPAIAPPVSSSVSYHIRSYAAQIRSVSTALGEKPRQVSETTPLATADFADSTQLRIATAYGTLAEIFTARADNAEPYDANWIKAQHYRQLFGQGQLQLRMAVDTDGDGFAERTRSLGNVTLKRI